MTKKVTKNDLEVTSLKGDTLYLNNTANMTNKISILFWFRKSQKDKKAGAIMLRVTVNGKRLEFGTTGLYCEAKEWDSSRQRFRSNHNLHQQYNTQLNGIQSDIYNIYLSYENQKRQVSAEIIRAIWKGDLKLNMEFEELLGRFFKERTYLAINTIRAYKSKSKQFVEFCRKNGLKNAEVFQINSAVMNRYGEYLKRRSFRDIYVGKAKQVIKTVLCWGKENGYIDCNNLSDYIIKIPKIRNRNQLSIDDIEILRSMRFRDSLQEVVDCFLFAIQTGYEYDGLKKLRFKSDVTYVDDRLCIISNRTKTGNERFIPLTKVAIELILKYQRFDKFPVRSNKYMNEALKIIAMQAGIDKRIHTHMARRIFANDCINIRGMSPEATALAMGQDDTDSIKFYAEVDRRRVLSEFKDNI